MGKIGSSLFCGAGIVLGAPLQRCLDTASGSPHARFLTEYEEYFFDRKQNPAGKVDGDQEKITLRW